MGLSHLPNVHIPVSSRTGVYALMFPLEAPVFHHHFMILPLTKVHIKLEIEPLVLVLFS